MVDKLHVPVDLNTLFARMGDGVTRAAYPKGHILFAQGDPANSVFYIQDGKAKVAVLSSQGKEAVVAILEAGDFCGEGCLAGQAVRMSTVETMTDCVFIRIEKAAMIRLLHDETDVSELFVQHLLARNARVESDLVDQLFNSSEKRLARLLLILSNFGKDRKPDTVITPISQETLAEMIGTTRSRVNMFMNKFRQLGFIDYNGDGLEVRSSLLRVVLTDSTEAED